MNLEQREMVFERIMNEFIIFLKPSPCISSNLFYNAQIYRVDPVNLRPKTLPVLWFRDYLFWVLVFGIPLEFGF